MKNGKSFICSVLEFISVIVIFAVCLLISDELYMIFIAGALISVVWLGCEQLEKKGKFEKIDQKLYDTAFFGFLKRHKQAVYVVLFTIAMCLTVLLFM